MLSSPPWGIKQGQAGPWLHPGTFPLSCFDKWAAACQGLSRLFHFLFLSHCIMWTLCSVLIWTKALRGKAHMTWEWAKCDRDCKVLTRLVWVWWKSKVTCATGQAGSDSQIENSSQIDWKENFLFYLILFQRACPITAMVQTPGWQTCNFSSCCIIWKCLERQKKKRRVCWNLQNKAHYRGYCEIVVKEIPAVSFPFKWEKGKLITGNVSYKNNVAWNGS